MNADNESRMMKSGSVAIVGRANVGKSTLLNALLGEKIAIVSDKPQTTRTRVLGVLNLPSAQVAFYDTPGLHKPQHLLSRRGLAACALYIPSPLRDVEERLRFSSPPLWGERRR